MLIPTIDRCVNKYPPESAESCFRIARPEKLEDCGKIPLNLTNYNDTLIHCYTTAMEFDKTACQKLPLSIESKDSCYNQANVCSPISSLELKEQCNQKVREMKRRVITNRIKNIIMSILYVGAPLCILFVIIKTIIDYIKKKKVSILKRIGLIILLILIWFFIVSYACLPPFCRIMY